MRSLGLRISTTDERRWQLRREFYANGSASVIACLGRLIVVGTIGPARIGGSR